MKKRYNNEEEILKEMEWYRQQVVELVKRADMTEASCQEWDEFTKEKSRMDRRKAYLLETVHLPKLKQKLAEMRTPQLPALDNGDRSIPA